MWHVLRQRQQFPRMRYGARQSHRVGGGLRLISRMARQQCAPFVLRFWAVPQRQWTLQQLAVIPQALGLQVPATARRHCCLSCAGKLRDVPQVLWG